MKPDQIEKCELFVKNAAVMKKEAKWESTMSQRMAALLFANDGLSVDVDKIKNCKRMIKEDTGIFSPFKSVSLLISAAILALENDPKTVLHNAIEAYESMKQSKFHSSTYLSLASINISKSVEKYDYSVVIHKAAEFFSAMKKEHPFLTTQEDYGFAVMLGMSDKEVKETVVQMEKAYEYLKPFFNSRNGVQSLSQILVFGEEDISVKCERAVRLYRTLKENGYKFGQYYELSSLGVLALVSEDITAISSDMMELHDYLKKQDGFGFWMSEKERLLYTAALIASCYLKDSSNHMMEVSLSNSITSILIAQQMAIISASAASSAAAASASS